MTALVRHLRVPGPLSEPAPTRTRCGAPATPLDRRWARASSPEARAGEVCVDCLTAQEVET